MTEPYRLHYAPDNASLIIRLALEELGVPYETCLVDRSRAAQKSAEYLAISPNGLIPALETPEGPIFETAAILLWLVDRHGALGPDVGAPGRGDFLKWLFFVSNTLHAAMRMRFYPHIYVGDDAAARLALQDGADRELRRCLDLIEACAAGRLDCIAGAQVSVLDLYLAAAMRWLRLYPKDRNYPGWMDAGQRPALDRLLARLEVRPSAQAAARAEGMGAAMFTRPEYPVPPEGSVL